MLSKHTLDTLVHRSHPFLLQSLPRDSLAPRAFVLLASSQRPSQGKQRPFFHTRRFAKEITSPTINGGGWGRTNAARTWAGVDPSGEIARGTDTEGMNFTVKNVRVREVGLSALSCHCVHHTWPNPIALCPSHGLDPFLLLPFVGKSRAIEKRTIKRAC